jgi:hypothetical protein
LQHQVEVDAATIAQRNAEVELALVNLGYADIVAPIDGIVLLRNISAGEVVQTSLQSPVLFVIASDLHALHLIASVDEVEIGAVRPGDVAIFTVKAHPDRTFPARIVQLRQPAELRPTAHKFWKLVVREAPGLTPRMRGGTEKYIPVPVWRLKRDVMVLSPSREALTISFAKGALFDDSGGDDFRLDDARQVLGFLINGSL